MVTGLILVILGFCIVILASMSPPQPPNGGDMTIEDWENYTSEMQSYADILLWGSVIEFMGLLFFMVTTICGVAWNEKKLSANS